MAVSTTNAPEITAEDVQRILTEPLEQESVFLAANPRIVDSDGSPVRLPAAPVSVADGINWHGENELISEVDPEFSEVRLLPDTMKSVKVITRYSNELARQSVVSLDAAIQARLVRDVAAKLDAQFLSAEGDGVTTPMGIFAYEGVQNIEVGGDLDLDTLLDAYGLALGASVNPATMRLFVRPDDYMKLRKIKDSDGRYLLQPDASSGSIIVPLLGATAHISARIPAGNAALVDMAHVAVARDLAPSVKVLTERYADYDQQAIRVIARYDAKPTDPAAVVTLTGIA